MKSLLKLLLILITVFTVVGPVKASMSDADFLSSHTYNNLISDGAFIDINSMTVDQIELFLQHPPQSSGPSFLSTYSEGGRSAAQIIYDAAHGHGEASGDWHEISINPGTGTVSPKVLLATLQKEEGLIYETTEDDPALKIAMGYGCYDGVATCDSKYLGFTNQVEWAAWTFRYSYEAALKDQAWRDRYYSPSANTFCSQMCYVGQTVSVTDTKFNSPSITTNVTFANAATASLYRYTPHAVYGGNNLFRNTYTNFFGMPLLDAGYVSQGPWDSTYNVNVALAPGETKQASVTLTNTGSTAWNQNGSNPVHLGVVNDRHSPFLSATPSFDTNRAAALNEPSVSSGQNGTFTFNLTAPTQAGTYYEYYQPVMEGIAWFGPQIQFQIKVLSPGVSYVTQAPWDPTYNVNMALAPGETKQASVTLHNSGQATWFKSGRNPIDLGVSGDRHSQFLTATASFDTNRAAGLTQNSVPSGGNGTFDFSITAPSKPGMYYEYFQPVVEGVTWLGPQIQFQIQVRAPDTHYVTQTPWDATNNVNIAFSPGQTQTATVTIQNTGGGTWSKYGANAVHLGVVDDKHSPFLNSPYFDNTRVAFLDQDTVPAGSNATFTFTMTAPSQKGTYYEYYQPLMEGVAWFGPHIQFQIKVQ